MKTMILLWELPATREQGGVLPPDQIAHVEIELSADAGANFTPVGTFTPDILQATVADLPFSDAYVVRGRAVDTGGQAGAWASLPFSVIDTSPPGVINLSVADA